MEPFETHTGIAAPLDRVNVDTDAIIPKQFLKKIDKKGFGKHLFHELRYIDFEGTKENPNFVLNQEPYRKATVLLTRDNFGCGSSREHAPWALDDFGFRVIIAICQRFTTKSTKYHTVSSAQASACQNSDSNLRYHRHIDGYDIAFFDTEIFKNVCKLTNITVQFFVG